MKKQLIFSLFFVLTTTLFSNPIYKEFIINGEKVNKWVNEIIFELEYDSNGNMTHHKSSNGFEYWHKYDSNGNRTYVKDSNGNENWYKYDSNGNMTYFKDSNGNEIWYEYEFNSNGKIIKEIVYEKF